ncbi:flagellar export chaperone FlgN [Clostridium formicaceticum]|uniref:FlgN protein n=1 Tax=Clostridium formicaceticum TaxID=1497 RepID=A0AAC9RHQ8_9CLOT|nr:flagellar export chaperone FlgN [Clostridium formicaceticum]AOY75697.1 hypothetical protein BJL90_07195 [Clostridium formicaceticum]ARE86017.1 FlgN protein [Clostridium formicaceticum]
MIREELVAYLLRISQGKLLLVNHLLKITQQQSKALEEEDIKILEDLVQEKQGIMEKIDVLDKEFMDKYSLIKEELGIENLQQYEGEVSETFKELKEKIAVIFKVIEEVHDLDQENTKKVKNNIAKSQQNIKSIKTGKRALAGYNQPYKESHSFFIDKKK